MCGLYTVCVGDESLWPCDRSNKDYLCKCVLCVFMLPNECLVQQWFKVGESILQASRLHSEIAYVLRFFWVPLAAGVPGALLCYTVNVLNSCNGVLIDCLVVAYWTKSKVSVIFWFIDMVWVPHCFLFVFCFVFSWPAKIIILLI